MTDTLVLARLRLFLLGLAGFLFVGTLVELVFTGHTHFPAIWSQTGAGVRLTRVEYDRPLSLRGGMHVVNPGSVGQPRNGDPAAHYALFDTQSRSITFARARYPVRRTMNRMRRLGYPEPSVARYAAGR